MWSGPPRAIAPQRFGHWVGPTTVGGMDETTSRDFSRMLTSARRRVHNARLRTTYGYLDYARQSTPPAAAEGPRLDERCGAIETEALEANFGFVDAQARRFSQVRPDLHDDLVQAGLGALLAAFRDWDPERASLIRFADRVIMKAINDATRKAERPDLSYGLWCQRPRVLSAAAVLRDRLGRAASVDEVARESGCTPNVVRRILATRTVACDAARTRTLSAFAQTLASHLGVMGPKSQVVPDERLFASLGRPCRGAVRSPGARAR